ncbi:MAG: homoserine dehydrogenase, partial [Anaerovoracaceae bacterium]
FNAVYVTGDMVGELMFYGRGAGPLPTGSAVCGDILSIMKRKF